MLETPSTSSFHAAVFYQSSQGNSPSVVVEVPAARSIDSLEAVSEWFKELNMPCYSGSAFISIELANDRLTEEGKMRLDEYADGTPDRLALLLRESVISFAGKLVNLSIAPQEDWEIETLELQVLNIERRIDTIPGVVVETSYHTNITEDVKWWGDRLPGSVIGHITIQVYNDALLDDTKNCLESLDNGDPDKIEGLIQDSVKNIIANLVKI